MRKYIECEAVVLQLLERGQTSRRYKLGDVWELNFDEIREAIASIPAADVRPVVLCRDCKHNAGKKIWLDHEETADCANGHGYPSLDWFCADGEKKEKS